MGARAVQISKHPETGTATAELLFRVFRFPSRTLGERIRRCRRAEHGLYQVQLAKQAGVDEMTIVNWEKDRTVPHGKRFARLARALGGKPGELIHACAESGH